MRNFFDELKGKSFKKITYTIFNRIDDDKIVTLIEKKLNTVLSIEDFEYYDFELSDKEKFLIKMRNKEIGNSINELKSKLNEYDGAKLLIDYNEGILRIVKVKSIEF